MIMPAEFYDTHAHLDFPDFSNDVDGVIERAAQAGISRIVAIGTDLESSARAVALSERYASVFAVVGWHPSHAWSAPDDIRAALRDLAARPKVVAIGETGLDYLRVTDSGQPVENSEIGRIKSKQADLFEQHLEVAAELGLNCVIHQRESFEATFAQMLPYAGRVRGVFHCFVNTPDEVRRVLEIGSIVSFTGILTFKNAASVREALAATPMGSFMLETDCPFLAPMPYRGKRCEPAYVVHTAAMAAQVKECDLETLSAATCATATGFFHPTRFSVG
ncbi:MAG: TatD family hydrolase [Verrucomicrobia bacterium]|nr:TatD family hydrolase [Verrucomicrobiota bacterium]